MGSNPGQEASPMRFSGQTARRAAWPALQPSCTPSPWRLWPWRSATWWSPSSGLPTRAASRRARRWPSSTTPQSPTGCGSRETVMPWSSASAQQVPDREPRSRCARPGGTCPGTGSPGRGARVKEGDPRGHAGTGGDHGACVGGDGRAGRPGRPAGRGAGVCIVAERRLVCVSEDGAHAQLCGDPGGVLGAYRDVGRLGAGVAGR